jgi:uncharacterized FAD-dependent dehydrogenase
MCPGGSVIASASRADEVVVNGMSNFARSAENANAAIVVQVRTDDFPAEPLGGGPVSAGDGTRGISRGRRQRVCPGEQRRRVSAKGSAARIRRRFALLSPRVTPTDLWQVLPPFVAAAFGKESSRSPTAQGL